MCSLHVCAVCGEIVTENGLRNTLVRCFRCPKAYHQKCRPRDVHNLGLGVFLCIGHISENLELPPLPPELLRLAKEMNSSGKRDRSQEAEVYFIPGVMVRLEGITPGTHIFAIKDALREVADVKFIEFNEDGDTSALARCADPSDARIIVKVANSEEGLCIPHTRSGVRVSTTKYRPPSFPTARILTGEEEIEYWRNARAVEKSEKKRPRGPQFDGRVGGDLGRGSRTQEGRVYGHGSEVGGSTFSRTAMALRAAPNPRTEGNYYGGEYPPAYGNLPYYPAAGVGAQMAPYNAPPTSYPRGGGARPDMYRGMGMPGQRMGEIAGDRFSRGPYEPAQGALSDPYSAPALYPPYYGGGYPEETSVNRGPMPYGSYSGRPGGGMPDGYQGHGS